MSQNLLDGIHAFYVIKSVNTDFDQKIKDAYSLMSNLSDKVMPWLDYRCGLMRNVPGLQKLDTDTDYSEYKFIPLFEISSFCSSQILACIYIYIYILKKSAISHGTCHLVDLISIISFGCIHIFVA